jgi:hypothetical protein
MIQKIPLSMDFIKIFLEEITGRFARQRREINEMNFFPVPDKDTGNNLYLTLKPSFEAISEGNHPSIKALLEELEEALLENAQGNIGLIISAWLSGFFWGVAKGSAIDAAVLALAFRAGAESAKDTLYEPKEGTVLDPILSVSQTALLNQKEKDILKFMEVVTLEAKKSLSETNKRLDSLLCENFTPQQIEKLKRRGVIDAGALGFVILLEGLGQTISNQSNEKEL